MAQILRQTIQSVVVHVHRTRGRFRTAFIVVPLHAFQGGHIVAFIVVLHAFRGGCTAAFIAVFSRHEIQEVRTAFINIHVLLFAQFLRCWLSMKNETSCICLVAGIFCLFLFHYKIELSEIKKSSRTGFPQEL